MTLDTPNSIGAQQVRCPQCGGPSLYASSNPYRPFCGERCRHLDLGAWASEEFKLPEQIPSNDPAFDQS
ncbi:MAG: DNA gyrase inhibitor YacG [Hydrogenophaga sp.]